MRITSGFLFRGLSGWLLLALAVSANAQVLGWVSGQPDHGAPGTVVTADVTIGPPVPQSKITGASLIFSTPDGQGVFADGSGFTPTGDPAALLAVTGTVPARAVSGPWAVVVQIAGQFQLLAVRSPTPFTVLGGSSQMISGTWVSAHPIQGAVGSTVDVVVNLSPPVAFAAISNANLYFTNANGQKITPPDSHASPNTDPVSSLELIGPVPDGAVTGPFGVVLTIAGLAQPLFIPSPVPFTVGTPIPRLTWQRTVGQSNLGTAGSAGGPPGSAVAVDLTLEPGVPVAAIQKVVLIFASADGKGIPAADTSYTPLSDPAYQIKVRATVPAGAVTGVLSIQLTLNGVSQPLTAADIGPFTVSAPAMPPPSNPPPSSGSLVWQGIQPAAGITGTPVTVDLTLNPPLPRASILQVDIEFATNPQNAVSASQLTFDAVGDPVTQVMIHGQVPAGITGLTEVAAGLKIAGQDQPLAVLDPAPFQIESGPLVAGGPIIAGWSSVQPAAGPPGTPVTVLLTLNPPIARSAIQAAAVAFQGPNNSSVTANGTTFDLTGDPATAVAVHFSVPLGAVTGTLLIGLRVDGLDSPLAATSPDAFQVTGGSGGTVVPGDMNGDGQVTISDAVLALRASVGLAAATPAQLLSSDFKDEGKITVGDALLILRAAVHLTTLPTPPQSQPGGGKPMCGVNIKC